MTNTRYGFVLLAAGNSSRLGSPKALLPYRNTTLLGHMLAEMQKLASLPICVVTGGHREQLYNVISGPNVSIVFNPDWRQGMGSSIRAGLTALNKTAQMENVIFSSCDQPNIASAVFEGMIHQRELSKEHIIACRYADTVGIPVLFNKKYFTDLMGLAGEKGAKSLLQKYSSDVATVPFPGGEVDIDTQEDYERLVNAG